MDINPNIICPYCQEGFWEDDVIEHEQLSHDDDSCEYRITCPECENIFDVSITTYYHFVVTKHKEEKP